MNRGETFAIGMGIGALLMYIFDPERGTRRRSLARDRGVRAAHKIGDAAESTVRDVRNRTIGLIAETQSLLIHEEVTDEVLAERVRAKMGRAVSHPGAIEVFSSDGQITLKGQILSNEVQPLLRAIRSVRGVAGIENQLDVRERQNGTPSLRGSGRRRIKQKTS